jgi:iron(III) transport system substrate-binding protein
MRKVSVVALAVLAGLSTTFSFIPGSTLGLGISVAQAADQEVNLYSYRQPFLLKPLLDGFTKETGIKVNVVYAKKGMLERLKAEGANSPADAILTVDIGRINDLVQAELLQPIKSNVLNRNIPKQYRHKDGLWFGLTARARILYAHKTRVKPGEVTSYEDLAKPHLKGRVCTRSGKHVYNISLVASMIKAHGEANAEEWAKGVKTNLARRPQGNDRGQVKAIYQGECDVSIGNHYYMGKMATNEKKPEQKKWAKSVRIVFPNQKDRGTHVNVSGVGVTTSAKNKANAIKLLEYLSGDKGQEIYAQDNFEYPVKKGIKLHPMIASWGDYKADAVHLSDIAKLRPAASKLMDRVNFDK